MVRIYIILRAIQRYLTQKPQKNHDVGLNKQFIYSFKQIYFKEQKTTTRIVRVEFQKIANKIAKAMHCSRLL